MKPSPRSSAVAAIAFLAFQAFAVPETSAGWSAELAAAQQASHQDVRGRARAESILRAAVNASQNGLAAYQQSGLLAESVPAGASREAAGAQAAFSTLAALYPQSRPSLVARLEEAFANLNDTPAAVAAGTKWGEHVADVILTVQSAPAAPRPETPAPQVNPVSRLPAPSPATPDELTMVGPGRYRFSLLAGAAGVNGYVDGTGAAARFDNPGGIAVDATGTVYISESSSNTIRRISPAGVVTTLAGSPGQKGRQDGNGTAARFDQPSGLAVDRSGNVYVADTGNNLIRKIDASGNVTTVAGNPGGRAILDGPRTVARFFAPAYLAADTSGNVFVTEDKWNDLDYGRSVPIRKVAPDGSVSTLDVGPVTSIFSSGTTNSYYNTPRQISVDSSGNLYVIDTNFWDYSNAVKLTPADTPGRYAANRIPSPGYPENTWELGMGLDGSDRPLITDGSAGIFVRTPDGGWQTRYLTGIYSRVGWGDELAVGEDGTVYVVSTSLSSENRKLGQVAVGVYDPASTGPTILVEPATQSAWSGDTVRYQVTALGTPPFSYQWYFNAAPIAGATRDTLELKNVQRADVGHYSVVVSDTTGSVTSADAGLGMYSVTPPTPSPGAHPADAAGASGAGSFDAGTALAMLGLLAAAVGRRRVQRSAANISSARSARAGSGQ